MDGADWDERYGQQERMWSGQPNPALVLEARSLRAGTALDVGCGEGADAIWLARRGWNVTGLDVSSVALERAARAAVEQQVDIDWVNRPLADFSPPPDTYELVCVLYPGLPAAGSAEELIACVAPAGTLLVVGHAHLDAERLKAHGHDPTQFLSVGEIAAELDDRWVIEADGQRPRVDPPPGAEHVLDDVLRARRVS